MSEVLLIRLGSYDTESIPWMVWSPAEQEIIASGELDGAEQLSSLTEHGSHREIKVLVPASDVTLRTISLPGKLNRQLLTAMPYMIEDELAQDVDKLFFALGDKGQKDGKPTVDVAIVERGLMRNWLSWLKQAELHATVLIPDAMCLPLYEHGTCGIQLNQQWLVKSGRWACNSVDSSWFDDYLNLSVLEQSRHSGAASEGPFTFITHSPCLISNDQLMIEEQSPELPLKLLLNNIASAGFNLLQGEFAVKKEGSQFWQSWKTPVIVAAVAVLMQLAYRGGMSWYLSAEVAREKAQFVALYHQTFPSSRMKENMMERDLKNRLKATAGGNSGVGFMTLLDQVAPLFAEAPSFVPSNIKYDAKRNELRFQASADGFQSFEKFKLAAENIGFVVQQGSLSNDGDKVVGAITVRREG